MPFPTYTFFTFAAEAAKARDLLEKHRIVNEVELQGLCSSPTGTLQFQLEWSRSLDKLPSLHCGTAFKGTKHKLRVSPQSELIWMRPEDA